MFILTETIVLLTTNNRKLNHVFNFIFRLISWLSSYTNKKSFSYPANNERKYRTNSWYIDIKRSSDCRRYVELCVSRRHAARPPLLTPPSLGLVTTATPHCGKYSTQHPTKPSLQKVFLCVVLLLRRYFCWHNQANYVKNTQTFLVHFTLNTEKTMLIKVGRTYGQQKSSTDSLCYRNRSQWMMEASQKSKRVASIRKGSTARRRRPQVRTPMVIPLAVWAAQGSPRHSTTQCL